MFGRLLLAAILAGLIAGGLMSALQQWRIEPIILAAEAYEQAPAHDHATAEAGTTAAGEEVAWTPANGLERSLYTLLANLLVAIGFTLVLGALALLLGLPLTAKNGLIWGLCGFLTVYLAPAFSLPPELPGMPAGPLLPRQIWWWATVLMTGTGLFAIARWRNWPAFALAALLIVLPHLVGAPQPPPGAESTVPAELASRFAAASFARSALFWLVAGPLMGWLLTRFSAKEAIA